MFIQLRRRNHGFLLTGIVAAIAAAGCGKQAGRQPATESASALTPTDTTKATPTQADTLSLTPPKPAPSAGEEAAPKPAQAAPARPLPRPNIDPGRKPPKPAPDSAASPSAAPAPAAGQDQWLKYDAAGNTVTFQLIAGPFNFNGYTNGGATLTLPSKANVVINFVNKDGTPHSAEVISGEGPIPNAATDPGIPRAYTNKVLEGLPQEATDVMRFSVPESGKYRIFCGVPGHGLSGMWIWMKVDPAAKVPSFGPTKG